MKVLPWLAGSFLACALATAQTPAVTQNGVVNAASYALSGTPGFPSAPGSLVAIFGTELAAGLAQADSIPLSTSLANVSVTFNATPAPLLFVSPGQINAQVPWSLLPQGVQTGTATVVVTRSGQASAGAMVQLAPFSPGIFTLPGTGLGPAVVVNNDDGSLAQPSGSIPGAQAHPAARGGIIVIYANGLGPVDTPVQDGHNSLDTLRRTTTNPTILIGGIEAPLLFSGLSPQFTAVNQVNAVVPNNAPTGDQVSLQIRIGGVTTSDQVTMAVR